MDSPSIGNYFIGKGIVSVKLDGDSDFRDVGNVTEFEFTPEVETLEHESSRGGVKEVDRTVVTKVSGTLRLVMEEWTAANLALALLGEVEQDSQGRDVIDIFSKTQIAAAVKLTGTNDVGPRWEYVLNKVDFAPSSSVSPLTDEWGQLEISGKCAKLNGSFGTATKLSDEVGYEDTV